MSILADVVSWVMLMAGGFFIVTGSIGLLRFPDFFTRLHAASITDSLGMGLVIIGMIFQAGLSLIALKLIFIFIFLVFASPTSTHALAKAALHGKYKPLLMSGSLTKFGGLEQSNKQ